MFRVLEIKGLGFRVLGFTGLGYKGYCKGCLKGCYPPKP